MGHHLDTHNVWMHDIFNSPSFFLSYNKSLMTLTLENILEEIMKSHEIPLAILRS